MVSFASWLIAMGTFDVKNLTALGGYLLVYTECF
jgi:hypothetical protein